MLWWVSGVDFFWAAVNYDYGVTEGYGGNHTGIDLAGTEGTPIYALTDGVVWATTFQSSIENTYGDEGNGIHCYGRMMIIKGSNNKLYLLGHLSKFCKNDGDEVHKGDIVAEVGNTGYSKGAHLHLEVMECNFNEKTKVLNKDKNKLNSTDGGDGISKSDGLDWTKTFTRSRLHPLK